MNLPTFTRNLFQALEKSGGPCSSGLWVLIGILRAPCLKAAAVPCGFGQFIDYLRVFKKKELKPTSPFLNLGSAGKKCYPRPTSIHMEKARFFQSSCLWHCAEYAKWPWLFSAIQSILHKLTASLRQDSAPALSSPSLFLTANQSNFPLLPLCLGRCPMKYLVLFFPLKPLSLSGNTLSIKFIHYIA